MVRDHEAAGSSPATPTIVVADYISFAAAFSFAKFMLFLTHPAAISLNRNRCAGLDFLESSAVLSGKDRETIWNYFH